MGRGCNVEKGYGGSVAGKHKFVTKLRKFN